MADFEVMYFSCSMEMFKLRNEFLLVKSNRQMTLISFAPAKVHLRLFTQKTKEEYHGILNTCDVLSQQILNET